MPRADVLGLSFFFNTTAFLLTELSSYSALHEVDTTKKYLNLAEEYMEMAYEKAKKELNSTHPIRLKIALGLSSFYFEVTVKN